MTMTDTEAKALEHACLSAGRSVHHFDRMGDDLPLRSSIVAHARAIERLEATEARHAAELRELKERFSEVAKDADEKLELEGYSVGCDARKGLRSFILPAPDPLKSWLHKSGYEGNSVVEQALADITKSGGKIVWEAGE